MFDDEQLVEEFGIGSLSAEERETILEDFHVKVGEALAEGLSDEQMEEFERIINGDQGTIDAFLAANDPDFQMSPTYRDLQQGYDEDPEKVPADKAYAMLLWTQVNNPNLADTMTRVKDEFKNSLNQ